MGNPFDEAGGQYVVLKNGADEYCLWPAFAAIPAGWFVAHCRASRTACIRHIEEHYRVGRRRLSRTGL
jgi:MbtH protein